MGQRQLEGMKDGTDPEVTAAAQAYQATVRKRLKLQAAEKQEKGDLMKLMKDRKFDVYRDVEADILVTIEESEEECGACDGTGKNKFGRDREVRRGVVVS